MGSTSLCSVLMRKRDRRSHAESQINHKQHLHAKNKHPFPPGRCSPVPIWHMVWCGGRRCELDLRPYLLPWPEIFVQHTNHTTKCNGPECFYNGKALLRLSFYFNGFIHPHTLGESAFLGMQSRIRNLHSNRRYKIYLKITNSTR